LAPIPILVSLGRELSDKLEVDFYQRHRDTDDWTWKLDGPDVAYEFRRTQEGKSRDKVALCLSLSGVIHATALPTSIDDRFSFYEITLKDQTPAPVFLRKRKDLTAFREQYLLALGRIAANHPGLTQLHLFPAIPAPVALVCGHALLPKAHPSLLVYDFDKASGGFTLATTVT
jgi:hypothetical protein